MPGRPVLYVLAGVNGAGKSSIGGLHLEDRGFGPDDWYNPDRATRALRADGLSEDDANSQAWALGRDALQTAIAEGLPHAFETTLGGNTIPRLIGQACQTHDVHLWYCGLASPEMHIERVRARVASGGHDIPEDKIRARWLSSQENLIALMPGLAVLQVYDNSAPVDVDGNIPDPRLVLEMRGGALVYPSTQDSLADTPEWAMAIVEAALQLNFDGGPAMGMPEDAGT